MVMNGYRNLPVFFKPRAEDEETKTELVFRKKKDKRKTKGREKGQVFDDDIGLESKISFKNTALNSYDSGRVTALLMDEAGKWPKEVPVNQYWPIVKKTMMKGAIKVGFCIIPSTANDAKSGGEPYKMLFEGSSQFDDAYTATGLYRYFCPAYDGYEGFIDEFGMSIIDAPTEKQKEYIKERYGMNITMGAKDYLLSQRAIIKDKKALSEEIRMNPFTEEEAFMIDQKKCYFNSEKIYNQIDFLKEERVALRRIRLYWKNERTVDWADDPEGSWIAYKIPDKTEANKYIEVDGSRTPGNAHKYVSGIDPFKSSVISGKGSMGVCYVFERLDPSDPNNTCMPIAEYVDRPRMKSMFHDEMLKAAVFWGYRACYENDVGDDFVDYFSNKGFRSYLMRTPESAIDRHRRRTVHKYGVTSGDAFAMARQLDTCISYIENHCEKVVYIDLLEELLQYDHENRTPYDRSVAFMISLLSGVAVEVAKKEKENSVIPIKTFSIRL
jgi:CRISPR/Cas system-associated exonuclease Cas4 (RecB family)